MSQTLRQKAAVKRLIATQECRHGFESNAHRDVDWCRDIAPDLLGFASLFAIGTAVIVLCGLIAQAVAA